METTSFEFHYNSLPSSRSGRISKNRFRYEYLWGLSKMYELYLAQESFVMIFDNKSDIDLFLSDGIHFYQLKTTDSHFTVADLVRSKPKTHSFLSGLYRLDNEVVKSLNIVSNAYLDYDGRGQDRFEKTCLLTLNEIDRAKIQQHIKEKCEIEPDFGKFYYIKSDICTTTSKSALIGKTVELLESLKYHTGHVGTLYTYLENLIIDKTTNELTFDKPLPKVGISLEELDGILKNFQKKSSNLSEHSLEKTKLISDYTKQISIKREIVKIIQNKSYDNILESISKNIKEELEKDIYSGLTEINCICLLVDNVKFPFIVTNNNEKYAFVIVGLSIVEMEAQNENTNL